ncbi:6-phosphogluconolactonase [Thermotoga sp. KOL6]|uniref:6-phosphogluconolactonase n=1 Tax=Thermotoga sp. KOL6 TaxID=126741 RepID=UPI000C779B00|nr:6-phosphogluconolactonase [Thermotoga sp. KOL6]PLV59880.1 6-phosphogluconolactonase [Thermotoga sp. KOL6]
MAKTVIYILEENFVDFVTEKIVGKMKELLREKEKIFVVLAGGNTPIPVYEKLGESNLPWEKIHFFLSDERYVPLLSEHSNFRNIEESFFKRIDIPKSNIHFVETSLPIEKACKRYEEEIKRITFRFDMSILGMGPDGHVASIFDLETGRKNKWVVPVPAQGNPNVPRITMTFTPLNTSQYVFFIIRGSEKRRRLVDILNGKKFPASFVKGQLKTVWFLNAS